MIMIYKPTVSEWQESILSLDDSQFFDLMRLYIGEVKTPYNKQRLTEQLASFIHNQDNQNHIINLLDSFDISILSAIYYTNNPTKETLTDFFAGDYKLSEVYAQLSNLVSRLILFIQKDKYSDKEYYRINPLIGDKLNPYLNISNILFSSPVVTQNYNDVFYLSPNFIAAFISFLTVYGCSCKNDGTIKKTDFSKLEQIFPGKEKCLQLLMNSFVNLSIVKEGERKMEIDFERLRLFCELSEETQIAFLCAAAGSRFSRDGLKKQAQLLLDCISSIPETGYTIPTITKLAFITASNSLSGVTNSNSRFSQILEAAKKEVDFVSQQAGNLIEVMLEAAIEFGLLQEIGKDENGMSVYKVGKSQTQSGMEKVLNIDSAYTVTILPGLPLAKLLPLTTFLQIRSFSIVSEYSITKQSVCAGFDKGYKPEEIISYLKDFSSYELPQNLLMSISEWYASYVSAMIYYGYILRVSGNNIQIAENNPRIKKHIKEKLAEGIYLLDVPPTGDIKDFINESGFDFMGKVKNTIGQGEKIPFPILKKGNPLVFESKEKTPFNFQPAAEILKELKSELANMNLEKVANENLLNRINQRMIISKEQLNKAFVRSEILEANGTDYGGKIHLIDSAIEAGDLMEITLPDPKNAGKYIIFIGKPISLVKQNMEAIARISIVPENNIEGFLVSKITHLRRLRF